MGKVGLITGASGGIGQAIALRLAKGGAKLSLIARSRARLDVVFGLVKGHGVQALTIPADLRDDAQVKAAVQATIDRFGSIDFLVNAAGAAAFDPLDATTEEKWDAVLDTNLKAAFLLARYVIPHMLERGKGDIVNIASIAGHQPFENSTAYCASKYGVIGFSKALALEVRKHGIRVIVVSPGAVDTPLWDGVESSLDRSKMLRPEDVAGAVVGALTFSESAVADELIITPPNGVL